MSDENPTPEEQKGIERSAGKAIALIIVVSIVVILLFWLIGYDYINDLLS